MRRGNERMFCQFHIWISNSSYISLISNCYKFTFYHFNTVHLSVAYCWAASFQGVHSLYSPLLVSLNNSLFVSSFHMYSTVQSCCQRCCAHIFLRHWPWMLTPKIATHVMYNEKGHSLAESISCIIEEQVFLSAYNLAPSPLPSLLSRQQVVSLSSCVSPVELADREGGGEGGK
jgi:hypothetical protein